MFSTSSSFCTFSEQHSTHFLLHNRSSRRTLPALFIHIFVCKHKHQHSHSRALTLSSDFFLVSRRIFTSFALPRFFYFCCCWRKTTFAKINTTITTDPHTETNRQELFRGVSANLRYYFRVRPRNRPIVYTRRTFWKRARALRLSKPPTTDSTRIKVSSQSHRKISTKTSVGYLGNPYVLAATTLAVD